jgi:hypothetical protein
VGIAVYFLATPIGMKMTKRHSPVEKVTAAVGDLEVSITYCRPYKKDRVIFGELVPYGEVWRTGANEATVFTTNQDVLFGEQSVAAGSYALFSIPEEDGWTLILNNTVDQWGAFDYDEKKDAARVHVPSETVENSLEQFTITGSEKDDGILLTLQWDATKVSVPVRIQ